MSKRGIFCTADIPGVDVPKYAHEGDAGADICASETVTIRYGERQLVRTGVRLALPDDVVAMVCSRSGLAHKNGLIVANAPGIIDSGYRGEIMVNLLNTGKEDFVVCPGMRIAQLVLLPFVSATFLPVEKEVFDELEETERGEGGHGSSGV